MIHTGVATSQKISANVAIISDRPTYSETKPRKISLANYRSRTLPPLDPPTFVTCSNESVQPAFVGPVTRVNSINVLPNRKRTHRENRPQEFPTKKQVKDAPARIRWISEETIRDIRDARGDKICNLCRITGTQKRINYHTRQHYTRWFCSCGYVSSSRDGVDYHVRREDNSRAGKDSIHKLYESDPATYPELVEHLGWTNPPDFHPPSPVLKPSKNPIDRSSVFQRLGKISVTPTIHKDGDLEEGEISSPVKTSVHQHFMDIDTPHENLIYEGDADEKEEEEVLTKEVAASLPPADVRHPCTTSTGTQTDVREIERLDHQRDEKQRSIIRHLQRALHALQNN